MSTRPDPNTPEAPQEAAEGRLSALEGSTGGAETLEGQNGPQAGADGFQGEQQPRGPVDWARRYSAQRQNAAAKARAETETLKATLATVRTIAADLFVAGDTETHRSIGRRLLNALAEPEPHNAGPSIREAAADDRRWWDSEKAGEQP